MSFIQIGSKMLPAEPGVYYWSEWKREVRVYRKGRLRSCGQRFQEALR